MAKWQAVVTGGALGFFLIVLAIFLAFGEAASRGRPFPWAAITGAGGVSCLLAGYAAASFQVWRDENEQRYQLAQRLEPVLLIEGGDDPKFMCQVGTPHKVLRIHNTTDAEAAVCKVDVEFDPFNAGVTHLYWHRESGVPATRETDIGPGGYAEVVLPTFRTSSPGGYAGIMTVRAWAANSAPTIAKWRVRAAQGVNMLMSLEPPI